MNVAVAVVVFGEQVLIGRRSPTAAAWADRAEFPGGKIEPGERPAAAAARECLEETGIAIDVGRLLHLHEVSGSPRIHFFLATPRPGQPVPRPPFAWRSRWALEPEEFPPANGAVLAWLAAGAAAQGGS